MNLGQPDLEETLVSVTPPTNIQKPAQLYFPNNTIPPYIGIVAEFIPNKGFLFSVVDPNANKIHLGVSISEDKQIINGVSVTGKKLNIFLQDGLPSSSTNNEPIISMSLPDLNGINYNGETIKLIMLVRCLYF